MAVDLEARRGLRQVATERTLSAKGLLDEALAADGDRERRPTLLRALNAYGLAARDWTSLFGLDPSAADAAEIRFWIADAWYRLVEIEDRLGGTPSPDDLAAARRAAVAARATSTGAYGETAAAMVVTVVDLALRVQHRLHVRTHGAQGIEERREPHVTGDDDASSVVEDPLPPEVGDAIAARDAYLARVRLGDDPGGKRDELAFQAAELHFLYGHFVEARRRFLPLYQVARCGPSEVGYRAWVRLVEMASRERNVPEARALAERRGEMSCDPAPPRDPPDAYLHRFQEAERSAPGPRRDRLWREAADGYGAALRSTPDSNEAPEYAINGAYAYKQIGAYAEALVLYRLLLDTYASEASLARLAAGDPRATPPRPPDPRRYAERRRYGQQAAEQIGVAEVFSLDYPAAAAAYDVLAANARFDASARRDGAHNAVVLHTRLGDRQRALAARTVLARLDPPPGALAEVDWFVASASLDAWDERAPDTGSNRAARVAALAEVERFANAYEARADAARFVVRAAAAAARLRGAVGDPQAAAWCARAVRAEDRARAAGTSPETSVSPEADLAARCALAKIDAMARADRGSPSGARRYQGDAAAIERALLADLGRVEARARRVEELGRRLGPGPWLVAAHATEAQLLAARRRDLAPLATDGQLRRALRRVDEKEARALVEVVLLAGALHVAAPEVVDARRRLAALVRLLGEPAMVALSAGIVDPVSQAPLLYREGMFASPPGMTVASGEALAAPLPVGE